MNSRVTSSTPFLFFFLFSFSVGMRRYLSEKILPYMVDWLFILILGISMAFLSFVIDYLIDAIGRGG